MSLSAKQTLMKKCFKTLLYSLALISLFASCSDDDNDNKGVESGDVQMLTFGFYAADNDGVIQGDYEVSAIAGTDIKIPMPDEINRASLVARFTTSDGATVTVNGITQVSGVTANNFSVPVDYLVTSGNNNARYTVRITKMPTWSAYSTFTEDSISDIVLRVNPKTYEPYVAIIKARKEADEKKVAVLKTTGSAWSYVGDKDGISDGRATALAFNFDADANMYVAYSDYSAEVAQDMTAQMYNGSSWSVLGAKGLTGDKINYITIGALSPADVVTTFGVNNKKSDDYKKLMVSGYNGSWASPSLMAGRPADAPAWFNLIKRYGDALYLGTFDMVTSGGYSIYKYQNKQWSTIGQIIVPSGAAICYRGGEIHFDLDKSGNIYALVSDDGPDGQGNYKVSVQKYNANTKKWNMVDNYLDTGGKVPGSMDIGISPEGLPVVVFVNSSKQASVITFDNESKQWSDPFVLGSATVSYVAIEFDQNGTGYIVCLDSQKDLIMYKYIIPE